MKMQRKEGKTDADILRRVVFVSNSDQSNSQTFIFH